MKEFVSGMHHIGIPTAHMDATIDFFRSFGAVVTFEMPDMYEGRPIRVTLMDLAGTLIECYERPETAMAPGAMDHIAFSVNDVEAMHRVCKEKGYRLMEECREEPGASSYWPKALRWFIVFGPNEEKIEFCQG